MNPDPTKWKFPVLASITDPGFHLSGIRELTEDEQEKLAEYTKIAASARNRFKLFMILKKNYSEWWDYTRSLLSPNDNLEPDEMVELDRLMLNFLSSAKSVLDQFKQHWTQAYRGTGKENDFKNYIKKLEDGCWAFAFFQDLRNFTQHCGLPIGNYTRNANTSSVTLIIQADSEWLIDHYNRWDKSKLTKERGRLDLMDLCRDYYIRLQQDFGNFVANAFTPELLEAHTFLAGLANEANRLHPEGMYRIVTKFDLTPTGFNFQFKTPPADLLGSLGISVRATPKTEEAEQVGAGDAEEAV